MNVLLAKYNDFLRLDGCTIEYKLTNGFIIKATYRKENFPHLIGLHKLRDIQIVQLWQSRSVKSVKLYDVLRYIKNERITDSNIQASVFYSEIKERYENFTYDNLTTLNYTDAIVDFDPTIINSKIKSDYILFEERPTTQYNHMGIALDSQNGRRYIETFFHEKTQMYISGQKILKVEAFRIVDRFGKIIVEDSF